MWDYLQFGGPGGHELGKHFFHLRGLACCFSGLLLWSILCDAPRPRHAPRTLRGHCLDTTRALRWRRFVAASGPAAARSMLRPDRARACRKTNRPRAGAGRRGTAGGTTGGTAGETPGVPSGLQGGPCGAATQAEPRARNDEGPPRQPFTFFAGRDISGWRCTSSLRSRSAFRCRRAWSTWRLSFSVVSGGRSTVVSGMEWILRIPACRNSAKC